MTIYTGEHTALNGCRHTVEGMVKHNSAHALHIVN